MVLVCLRLRHLLQAVLSSVEYVLAIRIMCINVILRNDVLQVAYEPECNMLLCFVFCSCF